MEEKFMLNAEFIEKIVGLANPPVVTANGDGYILGGYTLAAKPTLEMKRRWYKPLTLKS
jgi:hypothetical protein